MSKPKIPIINRRGEVVTSMTTATLFLPAMA